MTGKKGLEVSFLGEFVLYRNAFARIMMEAATRLASRYQLVRPLVGKRF
jgi:hypothetical protein